MEQIISHIRAICFFGIITFAFPFSLEADNYKDLQTMYQERMGISVCIPNDMVCACYNDYEHYFVFSNVNDNWRPLFEGGIVVKMDEFSYMVLRNISKTRPFEKVYAKEDIDCGPCFRQEFLHNVGLPWMPINYPLKMLNDPKQIRRTQKDVKKIERLLKKNLQTIKGEKWMLQTNADIVHILEMRYPQKIHTSDNVFNHQLIDSTTKCFGIDFLRSDIGVDCSMLCFISKGGKDIIEYVKIISQYITFNRDFNGIIRE